MELSKANLHNNNSHGRHKTRVKQMKKPIKSYTLDAEIPAKLKYFAELEGHNSASLIVNRILKKALFEMECDEGFEQDNSKQLNDEM